MLRKTRSPQARHAERDDDITEALCRGWTAQAGDPTYSLEPHGSPRDSVLPAGSLSVGTIRGTLVGAIWWRGATVGGHRADKLRSAHQGDSPIRPDSTARVAARK